MRFTPISFEYTGHFQPNLTETLSFMRELDSCESQQSGRRHSEEKAERAQLINILFGSSCGQWAHEELPTSLSLTIVLSLVGCQCDGDIRGTQGRGEVVVVGGKEGIKKRYNGVRQKEGFIRSAAYRTTFFLILRSNFLHFRVSLG